MTSQILWRASARVPGAKGAIRWWKNSYGTDLPPRGFVWILHGMGEHSGRYDEVARYLGGFGFDVLAPDHTGHGLSAHEGGLRKIGDFPEMIQDTQEAIEFWVRQGPRASKGLARTPWSLVGHSMGALLGLELVRQGRGKLGEAGIEFAQRAFFSAPPLQLRMPVPEWKKKLARVLRNFAPDLRMSNEISPDYLSYDAANVAAYRADPLNHSSATPKNFLSLVATAERVVASPQEFEIPLCLAVGADDPIVDPAAVKRFYDSLKTHKRFNEFPHMKHEILFETERQSVFKELSEWLL